LLRRRDVRPALRRTRGGSPQGAVRPTGQTPGPLQQGGAPSMTTVQARTDTPTIGELVDEVTGGTLTLRFSAYDGSTAGPPDSTMGLHLRTPRGLAYLVTAPGDLGLARAY